MTQNVKHPNIKIFWLELMLATIIPFVICWSVIPTNILNSNSWLKLLELIGIGGSCLMLFVGIPGGIIGIKKARRMEKLRTATVVLSIINLSAGIVECGMLIFILCATIFGKVSV